jgi:hypothetical protein
MLPLEFGLRTPNTFVDDDLLGSLGKVLVHLAWRGQGIGRVGTWVTYNQVLREKIFEAYNSAHFDTSLS